MPDRNECQLLLRYYGMWYVSAFNLYFMWCVFMIIGIWHLCFVWCVGIWHSVFHVARRVNAMGHQHNDCQLLLRYGMWYYVSAFNLYFMWCVFMIIGIWHLCFVWCVGGIWHSVFHVARRQGQCRMGQQRNESQLLLRYGMCYVSAFNLYVMWMVCVCVCV